MRLVVDTNVLITFFWKHSISHELFENQSMELFSPGYALEEIEGCATEIIERARVSRSEFEQIKKQLTIFVRFIPFQKYDLLLKKTSSTCPDKDDCDFFALALSLQCPLWSQDRMLKNQNVVTVLNTSEVINLFD